MGDRRITGDRFGVLTPSDSRTLAEAKSDASDRVLASLVATIRTAEPDPYILLALLFLIVGALKDNSGTAFASWPAGTRSAWNSLAQPKIDGANGLYQRWVTAGTAINAATTVAQADAVTF